MSLSYRADVDGLRAIAVVSVIAYHFSIVGFSGGYLGVDIFFVISGYLVTKIIWTEIQAEDFTLARFYERRLRRIMPALLVVLITSSVVAFLVLLPNDLMGYARSVIATLTFLANVYFWRDTNYFAHSAEEKPLLHMWSLGVEEQFYILLPVVLILLAAISRRWVALVLVALCALSLAANLALNSVGGRSPAFYMLPTRIWELGLGSVLAALPIAGTARSNLAEAAALLGIILVLLGLAFADKWPRAIPEALPVVIGTGLLIWAGRQINPRVNRLLSVAPALFVGRISYALYLWHWPVFVFATYYLVRDLTTVETVLAFSLTFVLATLSLWFVETPFRSKTTLFRVVGLWIGAGCVFLMGFSALVLLNDGFKGRLPENAAQINAAAGTNYRCPVSEITVLGGARACRLSLDMRDVQSAERVLFGNSHAQMYAPILRDLAGKTGQPTILVPMNGCLPFTNVNQSPGCMAQARRGLDAIFALPKLSELVIAFNWEVADKPHVDATGAPVADFPAALLSGLSALADRAEAAGIRLTLIGPIPTPGYDLASEYSRSLAFGHAFDKPLMTDEAAFLARHVAVMPALQTRLGARFIAPHLAICDGSACNWVIEGRSVFSDSNHIAKAELPRFRPAFEGALAP